MTFLLSAWYVCTYWYPHIQFVSTHRYIIQYICRYILKVRYTYIQQKVLCLKMQILAWFFLRFNFIAMLVHYMKFAIYCVFISYFRDIILKLNMSILIPPNEWNSLLLIPPNNFLVAKIFLTPIEKLVTFELISRWLVIGVEFNFHHINYATILTHSIMSLLMECLLGYFVIWNM